MGFPHPRRAVAHSRREPLRIDNLTLAGGSAPMPACLALSAATRQRTPTVARQDHLRRHARLTRETARCFCSKVVTTPPLDAHVRAAHRLRSRLKEAKRHQRLTDHQQANAQHHCDKPSRRSEHKATLDSIHDAFPHQEVVR